MRISPQLTEQQHRFPFLSEPLHPKDLLKKLVNDSHAQARSRKALYGYAARL